MNTTVLDYAENFKTTFFFLRHSHVSQSGLGLFNPSIVPPPPNAAITGTHHALWLLIGSWGIWLRAPLMEKF